MLGQSLRCKFNNTEKQIEFMQGNAITANWKMAELPIDGFKFMAALGPAFVEMSQRARIFPTSLLRPIADRFGNRLSISIHPKAWRGSQAFRFYPLGQPSTPQLDSAQKTYTADVEPPSI